MVRASGTQEEQRSRIIRPADAQMFVLVAARVETTMDLAMAARARAVTLRPANAPGSGL